MRKRSKYRPKPVLQNPLAYVLESITPVRQYNSYLLDLKIKNHGAMTSLMKGVATKDDMNILLAMNNIVEALWRMGFGKQYTEVMRAGYQALLDSSRRFAKDNRVTLYAHEIAALNDHMELHDEQMEVITIKDIERALVLIRKEVAAGKAERIIEKEIA